MPTVVLATSNGTGMGHLARASAIALAAQDAGRFEPVLLSLSQALPQVRSLGLRGEYCPSTQRRFMTKLSWHQYLADRITALVEETGATAFVFDGAYPYHGLALARRRLPAVAFVWLRRAMWKPGANQAALRTRRMFDAVIEPGDLAAAADRGATAALADAVRLPPVTLLGQVDALPRREARAALGLDGRRPVALVTLRAGGAGAAEAAVRAVLADERWQVALTRSPISVGDLGLPADASERVVLVRGVFPLARYLRAFDAAVTETGYNSFHEMLHGRVPAVFVPTSAAVTDDQAARARWAEDEGLALTAAEDDPAAVAAAVGRLLGDEVRAKLSGPCAGLPDPDGAAAAAGVLDDLAGGFRRHRFSAAERVEIARSAVRPAAVTLLGTRPVAAADRLIGRRAEPTPKLAGPAVFAEAAGAELVSADAPVEDLLPGSSPAYRERRAEIAERAYPG